MKARIIFLIFISSLGVFHAGKAISQEGIEEKLFNETFPELQDSLIYSNKKKLSSEKVKELRDLFQKLDNALKNDLNAFKYGALSTDNALVFKCEKLEKAKNNLNIEKLENLITAEKKKIKVFLGMVHCNDQCEQTIRNLALFQQAYKLKKWNLAYQYWNVLFHHYPKASKIIYSKGADILEYKFEQTKNKKWIDTLMLLYDQRIKYKFFGKKGQYPEGYILGRKAVDLLKHRKQAVEQAYAIFEKSINLSST